MTVQRKALTSTNSTSASASVASQKSTQNNGFLSKPLTGLNGLVSAISSLTFAFFAFGNPEKYDDSSWWSDLLAHPGRLIIASLSATANFLISTYSHLTSIPDAFTMVRNRLMSREYWKKNLFTNLLIVILALTGSIAAGAVGFAAVAKLKFLGLGWAYFNAAITGFIFFVTRVFGLYKIADKATRFINGQHHCVEKITQLKDELRINQLNSNVKNHLDQFIQEKTAGKEKLDEEAVGDILKEVMEIIGNNPECYDPKKQAQQSGFPTLDVIMAVTGLICAADVTPIFAQRFANGCDQLIGFHPGNWWNLFFASSNFFLYFNQAISFKDIIAPIRKTLSDPNVPKNEKYRIQAWLVAFALANGFAARSLYNLVICTSTSTNPTYSYPDPFVGPGTSENPSSTTYATAALGALGVGILNTNFTIKKANESLFKTTSPAATTGPSFTSSISAGPRFTLDDVINYLKTGTPLSAKKRAELNTYANNISAGSSNKTIKFGLFAKTTAEKRPSTLQSIDLSQTLEVISDGQGDLVSPPSKPGRTTT